MTGLTLHGAPYSVYARIARLILAELGLDYRLKPVDIFADPPETYRTIHPFGKIPALDHDGWVLYETDAIAHYLITLTGNHTLLSVEPRKRARTIQIMRVMDNYAYPCLVWGVYVAQKEGASAAQIDDALASARPVLDALGALAERPYLTGAEPSLADLWAYPMLVYFALSGAGAEMLNDRPFVTDWMARMHERPSVRATLFPAETDT